MQPSIADGGASDTWSISDCSPRMPTTAAASSASGPRDRAAPPAPATRSRTPGGTACVAACRSSLTKNGLPAVVSSTVAGSRPVPSSSTRTPSSVSGGSGSRLAARFVPSSPSRICAGARRHLVVAVREDQTHRACAIRRAMNRTASSVASSAQWRSSITITSGAVSSTSA